MTNQNLKVFFPALKQTFTIEPVYPPDSNTYWVIDEEKEQWYNAVGAEISIMTRKGKQVFFHLNSGVKVGEIV